VTPRAARYDGHADWYDETFSEFVGGDEANFLRESLGSGRGGLCLDVACGTGRFGPMLAEAGYRPIGVDISSDQLRLARRRLSAVVQADACCLPLGDGITQMAVGLYFHTDVEDFDAVVREIARCLASGGRLTYVGLHPCFVGPFIERSDEDRSHQVTISSGYAQVGWSHTSSASSPGLWRRVGGHHKTLAAFVGAFVDARLSIETLREFSAGGTVLPRSVGVIAEKR
jgi:SAM-dependent methyltransferase